MNVAVQQLSFGGSALAVGSQTLSAAGVVSGSIIDLALGSMGSYVIVAVPAALQATYGATIGMAADGSTTVLAVKAAAAAALGKHRMAVTRRGQGA